MQLRTRVMIVVVLVVAALAGWWRWHHGAAPADRAVDGTHATVGSNAALPSAGASSASASASADGDALTVGALRLEGQVLGPDSAPILGAIVTLVHPARTAITEADGGFAFDRLAAGEVALSARTDDLISAQLVHQLTATSDPVVIHLARAGSIGVRVHDEAGAPIANATVEVPQAAGDPLATDAQGKAVLRPVRAGPTFVQAKAPGYASAVTRVVASATSRVEVTLTLRRGTAISGRVVDDAGAPVAGAWLSPESIGGPRTFSFERSETAADGAFTITLAPGRYRLAAHDQMHLGGTSAPIDVATAPITGVTITMTAGAIIDGVVVDRADHGVAGARVRAIGKGSMFDMGNGARSTISDADGHFVLRGLPRTPVTVGANGATLSAKTVVVDLADRAAVHDVKLVLALDGTIAGTVVDEDGHPVAEARVQIMPDILAGASMESIAVGGLVAATTDSAGAFAFHALDDGAFRLSASRDGSLAFGADSLGTAAHTGALDVKLVLPTPGVLVANIVIAGGGAPTLAVGQLGQHGSHTAQIVGGALRLEGISPGSYALIVRGPEFATHTTDDVAVTAGKTTDLGTITVSRGRALAGHVVDGDGQPVAGATVMVGARIANDSALVPSDDGSGPHTAVSAADGSFRVGGLGITASHALADHPTRGRSIAIDVPAGADDPPPVTLALHGFGSLVGTVTSHGKPVGSAMVVIAPQGQGHDAQRVTAMTSSDGTFAVARLPEGPEMITVHQLDVLTAGGSQVAVPVTIVVGQQATVAIELSTGGATLTVQLQPQAGAKVDAVYAVLAPGAVTPHNGAELEDEHGSAISRISMAPTMPIVFADLQPGGYTLCVLPITGNLLDPAFMKWSEAHETALQIVCQPVTITGTAAQTMSLAIGSMQPPYVPGT